MSEPTIVDPPVMEEQQEHWTARFSGPIIFVILTLIGAGAYLAFDSRGGVSVDGFPAHSCWN